MARTLPPLARPAPPATADAATPADAAGTNGRASPRSVDIAPPIAASAPATEYSQTDASIIFCSTAAAAHNKLQQHQRDARRPAAARPRATACDGRNRSARACDRAISATPQHTTHTCHGEMP